MTVVFVSNYLNHHSAPLCEAFLKQVDSFYFVSTVETEGVGFTAAVQRDYVLSFCEEKNREKICSLLETADFVIFGDCPNELVAQRMAKDRISFIYSERLFKTGAWHRFIPRTRRLLNERFGQYTDKKLYTLCASSFLPDDLEYLRYPRNKCFKWGYFPELEPLTEEEIISEKKNHQTTRLLWAARLIPLKHPEVAIALAEKLRAHGIDFELNIVGDGPLKDKLEEEIKKKGLDANVKLLGAFSPYDTRMRMLQSDVFLFTSDHHEGWGAVVNEAMNAGCAVVCSDAVGSAKYLIKDGENGTLYPFGNTQAFVAKVMPLLLSEDLRLNMGLEANRTISSIWNAEEAVRRLISLVDALEQGNGRSPYENGPCSDAD